MRLNVEDGLPVELAGCDEEQTPRPEQIHNLHEILLQKKNIGFTRLRANPAKKEKVQGRQVRLKLLIGNYCE